MTMRPSGPSAETHHERSVTHGWARARRHLTAFVLLFLVGAGAPPASALEALSVDLPEAVEQAGVIFRGLVTSKVVAWNEQHTIPLTTVTVSVVEALKGASESEDVELVFAGGTIEGQPYLVADLPIPDVGDEYVVFAHQGGPTRISPILGANQWYFRVDTENGGGDDAELRDFDGRTVIGIDGTRPRAVAAEALALAATNAPPDGAVDANGNPVSLPAVRAAASDPPRPVTWRDLKTAVRTELGARP